MNAGAPPALVFLHGFALDARMWRRQVPVFARDFHVLTVDLPGFGPQAVKKGTPDGAREVARAMNAANVGRAHFVANSYGAAVAVDLALRQPDRVRSLVLMGPLLLGRRTGIDAWPRCVSLAREGDRATALEMWLDDPLFDGVRRDEDLFEEVRQIVLDYGGAHWTGRILARWGEPDPVSRLKDIDIPTLILSGDADIPSFQTMAETYASSLPRARREVLQDCGHLVNLERPREFNGITWDFLKRS